MNSIQRIAAVVKKISTKGATGVAAPKKTGVAAQKKTGVEKSDRSRAYLPTIEKTFIQDGKTEVVNPNAGEKVMIPMSKKEYRIRRSLVKDSRCRDSSGKGSTSVGQGGPDGFQRYTVIFF